MSILTLTNRERNRLEQLVQSTDDAHQLRRLTALLALDAGQGVSETARTQRVSRSTSSEWVHRFLEFRRAHLQAATTTRTAPGRSRELRDPVLQRVPEHVEMSLSQFRLRQTNWTTELLIEQLGRQSITACDSTIRRALHTAGYHWSGPDS